MENYENKNLLDANWELEEVVKEDLVSLIQKRRDDLALAHTKAGPGDEYDYEGYMVKTQLRRMQAQAAELLSLIDDDEQFPAWMQSKVTLASEYMDGVYDYYKYSDYNIVPTKEENEEEEDENE